MPAFPATIRTRLTGGRRALTFSSGITPLMDQQSSFNRNRTDGFSGSAGIYRGRHNFTVGGDLRKQQFNDFFQQTPEASSPLPAPPRRAYRTASRPADPTSPTSSSVCRIPAPSPSGTRTNIYAKPFTTPISPTTGVSNPTSPSTPGLRWEYGATDHRNSWATGQS